ncbi:TPA: type 1 fimbrial protein [Proteus mirabilis]|nr:type 1 fimbrial protein [Proteus mirabilis]
MDFKMKKSLFSLLILSTLSLSTLAIAQEISFGEQNIPVRGRVIQDNLTCEVQPVAPIQLDDADVNSIESTPRKTFSIVFSGCTNQNVPREVSVVIAPKTTPYLVNASSTVNDTNAQVALLDNNGYFIPLDDDDSDFYRTYYSTVVGDRTSISFSLAYVEPESLDDAITPGVFSSTLSFDAFVTDEVY